MDSKRNNFGCCPIDSTRLRGMLCVWLGAVGSESLSNSSKVSKHPIDRNYWRVYFERNFEPLQYHWNQSKSLWCRIFWYALGFKKKLIVFVRTTFIWFFSSTKIIIVLPTPNENYWRAWKKNGSCARQHVSHVITWNSHICPPHFRSKSPSQVWLLLPAWM